MKLLTPAFRVSIGLMFLTVSILLAADLLGIIPDTSQAELDNRKKFIETLAIQVSYAAQNSDLDSVTELIHSIEERYDDVNSVALRTTNGKIQAMAGDHAMYWTLPDGNKSSPTQVRVKIFDGDSSWGTVEMSFVPLQKRSRIGLPINPVYEMILFIAFIGFFAYLLFMKRTLQHLDPSAVIPERVQSALDTLTEGLVLMDEDERIVLANTAFSRKAGKPASELLGKKVSDLNWSLNRKDDELYLFPWQETLRDLVPKTGNSLKFETPEGQRILMINSSPIFDGNGNQRGALATFDDVTDLEKKNSDLKQANFEIAKKNEQLELLATTDSLTGCLNRRAFFEVFNKTFEEAKSNGEEICSIMADIDNFKSVNDDFGHGAGDVVIQKMAEALLSSVREEDIVCRYGGEEFCILMPGISLNDATQIAERIRTTVTSLIEEEVNVVPGRIITTSLGISSSYLGADDQSALVDQADQALYSSKEGGRNKVTRFDEMEDVAEPA